MGGDRPAGPAVLVDTNVLLSVTAPFRSLHDANLVASALADGVRTLVTANGGDFVRFGKKIDVIPLGEELPY